MCPYLQTVALSLQCGSQRAPPSHQIKREAVDAKPGHWLETPPVWWWWWKFWHSLSDSRRDFERQTQKSISRFSSTPSCQMSVADLVLKPVDFKREMVTPQYWERAAPESRWQCLESTQRQRGCISQHSTHGSPPFHMALQTLHRVWSPNGEVNLSHKDFIP